MTEQQYKTGIRILALVLLFTMGITIGIWIGAARKDRAWREAIYGASR